MTNLLFLIPLTLVFFLLVMVRNEILFLKAEVSKNKDEIVRLEEMMSPPNALKQSESIDSKKKWQGLREAFTTNSKPMDKGYLNDGRRS